MGIFDKSKEDDTETYEYQYTCSNCEDESTFEIPFGTRAKDYLKTKKCEVCGCSVIEDKKESQKEE